MMKLARFRECEIHHLLDGGRRIGHEATVGLSPWHHRGVCDPGMTSGQMELMFGPSLAYSGAKRFRAAFGTDEELLRMQNRLIEARLVLTT